jgi:hypothetical protein
LRRYTRKQKEELKEKYGKPIGFKNNIPIFKAIKKNYCQMKIFCPKCMAWHTHGLDTELGHRSAHCDSTNPDSYYRTGGYYIFLVEVEKE